MSPLQYSTLVFLLGSFVACGGTESTTGTSTGSGVGGGGSGAGGSGASGGDASGGSGNTASHGGRAPGGAGSGGTTGGVANTGGAGNSGSAGSAGSGAGGTSGTPGCERAGLEAAVDSYLAALEAGDSSLMALSAGASYAENFSTVAFGEGLWLEPVTVDFSRSLLDVTRCASFTEIISATNSHPYVLGVRLQIEGAEISEVSAIVTDEGDWLFDADVYLQYSPDEDWSLVPEAERLSYEELRDGALAYFKYWGDKSYPVPWGMPCARLEGGVYTGDGPNSSCNVGVPDEGFEPMPTDHLVDVDYGMTVLFLNLGGADSHLFRILDTGIRYVHTLTEQE